MVEQPNQLGEDNGEDDAVVIHNGKKYTKIEIEDLGDDDQYLLDEEGNIYSMDFKFITNMGDDFEMED
jgi:cytoplasmic iron level regulating protein YaaA (DUF328/UPF0246 family)